MQEMTPEQMRARIAELEGALAKTRQTLDSIRGAGEPLTEAEFHDMLHGPRAPEGSIEKLIAEMQLDLGLRPVMGSSNN